MSKLIIVFCLALFVSASHADQLSKDQNTTLQAAKDKCIRSIELTFEQIKKSLEEETPEDALKANHLKRISLKNGAAAIDDLIERVNKAESLDDVEKNYIYVHIPIYCSTDVLDDLTILTTSLLDGEVEELHFNFEE